MELTVDYLKNAGFTTNHVEKPLAKYVKQTDTYYISIRPVCNAIHNCLTYTVECETLNDSVNKKIRVTGIRTIEELNHCLAICNG